MEMVHPATSRAHDSSVKFGGPSYRASECGVKRRQAPRDAEEREDEAMRLKYGQFLCRQEATLCDIWVHISATNALGFLPII